jgi:hypothetical protein
VCCERPDCIVPAGYPEQGWPHKSEGKLCDHCNPLKPECKEAGARCIVVNTHETFCGKECKDTPCPASHDCLEVKLKVGTTWQCVPRDLSCVH